jgi:hypothetical protein
MPCRLQLLIQCNQLSAGSDNMPLGNELIEVRATQPQHQILLGGVINGESLFHGRSRLAIGEQPVGTKDRLAELQRPLIRVESPIDFRSS